jgi:nicotinate-nucleotide--dimethylbenzimidazole phosphoribosyltransferase
MATTDARPGFKLPWSTERTESDSTDAAAEASPASTDDPATHEPAAEDGSVATVEPVTPEEASPLVNETPTDAAHSPSHDPWRLGEAPPAAAEPAATRKPNRLMADLTKAMQTAAETTREETLARLQADAKAHVESIHTRSAGEAEELRHTADADIAAIREWSKAEIARIREETDQKVVDRKATLEFEIEEHAARIEQRIERVQNHVAQFENEMATFFEHLLAEEDPTQLAAMAESLPEPPSFDDLGDLPAAVAQPAVAAPVEADAVAADAPAADAAETVAAETESFEATRADTSDTETEAFTDHGEVTSDAPAEDPEAAFAAIQAAAEAAAASEAPEPAAWTDNQVETPAEAPADDNAAPIDGSDDPRLTALGLSGETATEATTEWPAESAPDAAPGEDFPTLSDDVLAARLAGLVPGEGEVPQGDLQTTRVVVTGLVSVASIASFKRHLGKIEGVASVGVSSGPDGEFVFAVGHGPSIDLQGAIPALPGFAAQITSVTDDTVSVAARDPEAES